jgi:hypothetical protein
MRYVIVVAVLVLSGCSPQLDGDLDEPAQRACDDLASYMQDEAVEGRKSTLTGIADLAKDSKHKDIVHGGKSLEDLADAPGWESGADVLAAACLEHGWE